MTTRDQLHRLVDELPKGALASARHYPEYLRDLGDAVVAALLTAPLDDEPETVRRLQAGRHLQIGGPVSAQQREPPGLGQRLKELAAERRRYGYRRLWVLLRREASWWRLSHGGQMSCLPGPGSRAPSAIFIRVVGSCAESVITFGHHGHIRSRDLFKACMA